MDTVAPHIRSKTMAAIRGQGTSIEVAFEASVHRSRFSFIAHPAWLGRPDFAFPTRGIVVFLDSCFWHKCPVHFRPPKSRQHYWEPKIARNVERDSRVRAEYQKLGWTVIQFWEHAIGEDVDGCVKALTVRLRAKRRSRLVPPAPKRTPGGGVRFLKAN